MNKAYHITQWDSLYETCETRKIRTLTFYAKPNKLIGEGIGLTLQEPDGLALLGTWSLLVDLASLSAREHRGWLIRNGTALTAARMGALLRVPAHHFERALEWFSRPEIGWLEYVETPLVAADSPAIVPPRGKSSADSPAIVPQEEGKREGEREEKEREERDALTLAAARASAPSPKEVEEWAAGAQIPPAFALEKLREALEREDFAKPSVRKHWQARFARFWETDAPAWRRKMQKNAAPQNGGGAGRPDGWKAGDQDFWWTDELPAVRATMAGAAHSDKKTAARISEIIKQREKH
jgi:hypothetical protein